MGKRGPQPPGVVTSFGYFIAPFPMTRDRAGELLGAEVPPGPWAQIVAAWSDLDSTLARLKVGATLKGQADAKARALDRLGDVLKLLMEQRCDNEGNQILSASINRLIATETDDDELQRRIDALDFDRLRAAEELLWPLFKAVRDAAPLQLKLPTEGAAKAQFVRASMAALRAAGIPTDITGGGGAKGNPGTAPTPFERFIDAIGIHQANSKQALSGWLRDVRGGKP